MGCDITKAAWSARMKVVSLVCRLKASDITEKRRRCRPATNNLFDTEIQTCLNLDSIQRQKMPFWKGVTWDERSVNAGDENAFQLYHPAFISAAVLALLCACHVVLSDVLGAQGRNPSQTEPEKLYTLQDTVRVTAHGRHKHEGIEGCIDGGLMSEVVDANTLLQRQQNQTNFQTGSKQPTQVWNATSNRQKNLIWQSWTFPRCVYCRLFSSETKVSHAGLGESAAVYFLPAWKSK